MDARTKKSLTKHLRKTAKHNGVTLAWTDAWHKAESFPELMYALVPQVACAGDYLVGLHELGHCIAPDARRLLDARGPYARLTMEGSAWAWAMANAAPSLVLEWGDFRMLADCWESHLRYEAKKRLRVAALSHEAPVNSVRHSTAIADRTRNLRQWP